MRPVRAAILLSLALLAASASTADVLVTIEGTVVETKGPWQQRGKMVVFTLAGGQLSSLRAEDIDFEATESWRAELAQQPAAETPAPPAEAPSARLVLTDADVARGVPIADTAAPAEVATGAEEATAPTDPNVDPSTQSAVRVTAWEQEEPADGRGRRVFGTLRNDGNTFATDIAVAVTAYDNDGAIAGTQTAIPVNTALRPGESTTFSTQFTEVYVIGATRISVNSLDLVLDDGGGEDDDSEL